jgi:hypothetical protein
MLIMCRTGITAFFLPATMFLRALMLRPALTLPLTLPRLPTVFPAAGTTLIPIPIGLLNSERPPDRWD